MQLTIFNGSPRGQNSNSTVLIQWLVEGIQQNPDIQIDTLYLNKIENHPSYISRLQASNTVIIVFPLYTDCMPGIVMAFIELLESMKKCLHGLKLGFVVHSGFPEAHQSRSVEKYLQWLATELDVEYIGTVIMGGSEGIRIMPPSSTRKKRALFNDLGRSLAAEQKFNPDTVKKLAGFEKLSNIAVWLLKLLTKTKVMNTYWDRQLKNNNAYQDSFARPYSE